MLHRALWVLFFCLLPGVCFSFGGEGCGAGECRDCHSLTAEEAFSLLPPGLDKVNSVKFSEVGGLWEVEGQAQDKTFNVFIDFSKQYLVTGKMLRLRDGAEVSRTVAVAEIDTASSLLIGRADAPVKVFVFTDVQCSHCRRLHGEMQQVVELHPEFAFYIKLLPIMMSKELAADILCSGSLQVLNEAFAGQPVAKGQCDTEAVDETLAFAKKLAIGSTPTMVLPDGKVLMGARPAHDLALALSAYLPAAGKQ